ncbi:hypothetical protein EDB80DRAFT_631288 [Ilyonectria destructans]|nr:hypothetical protein EDB80DRAFT_631288 [Ilyonectria destructans]
MTMVSANTNQALPVLDFSAFGNVNTKDREQLVQDVQAACKDKGFFQIINHGIPSELQQGILNATKNLFALPKAEKLKVQKVAGSPYRGYEGPGVQRFEVAASDTKESFVLCKDKNLMPEALGENFKAVCDEYFDQMFNLATVVLEILGLGLGLSNDYFHPFNADAHAVLRLLHYPPSSGVNENERGIGAHRDFGCVTLLLQDEVGGLQVQDMATGEWIDVKPIPGAYVVNLGNLMMRWSNSRYTSNIHRVINVPGKDRYSIPFFFGGNMDFVFDCLPGCRDTNDAGATSKHVPISVRDFVAEQHRMSYEGSTKDFIKDQQEIGFGNKES